MLFPTRTQARISRAYLMFFPLCFALCFSTLSFGQQSPATQPAASPAAPSTAEPTKPEAEKKAAAARPAEPPLVLQQLNSAITQLTARISPAVVQILVNRYGTAEGSERGQTALVTRENAIGSGVIVDPDGYIMTNAHVVEGAQRIHVALAMASVDHPEQIAPEGKQRIVEARLIGFHKDTDLALIKIDQTGLPTLSLGSRRAVHQGELVFAMGSPEGLENSVTMGIVSAVARQADPSRPMVYIQTDAPINPGNSGGPLVDTEGYVIGLNTFILSEAGGSEGLGFAIPARIVRFVYESLRKYGHVHRIEVKAGAQTITESLAKGLGLAQNWGVVIDDVTPGGPADAGGLKIGDIVLRADGRPINTLPAFTSALYLHPLDESLKLEILRGTEHKTLYIVALEMKDAMDALPDLANPRDNLVSQLGILGLTLDDKLRPILDNLRNPSGVIVVARVASFLSSANGLQTGDVIHSVNQTPIDSLVSLRAALHQIKPHEPVVLQVERATGLQWMVFDME
ncbi:MAG TPA: trypsin-like peptidase domain-containing protein [Terriglobales bacterium]|nr:trypsin-like peptidase domain-containing protein [Terriglobales bacterium]